MPAGESGSDATEENGGIFCPADQADAVLPPAAVVLIMGTTLVNDTVEHPLALCRPAARVVVVGPTIGLLPGRRLPASRCRCAARSGCIGTNGSQA